MRNGMNKRTGRLTRAAAAAVVTFLATASVVTAQTPASGAQAPVTFTKDVAPILYRSCVVCHRPGSIAPMSLMTYEDTRPWARSIRQRVTNREMPPWYIERNIGIQKFKNDPSLTAAEIATIGKWVDGGTVKGEQADMPPAPTFANPNEWAMGKPDLILTTPKVVTVAAVGPDWWVDMDMPSGLTEDRYIQAIESKPSLPGSEKVVHHATTNMEAPDGTEGFLNEYAVGKNADVFPGGTGRLMKAGSTINFNLHLHSIGEETKAGVSVGIKFYPKGVVPLNIIDALHTGDSYDSIDVPAGEVGRVDGYQLLTSPTKVVSFQPHMHNRGSRQCVEAIFPNGKVETISCAKHNFAWMLNYTYADDVAPLLPAYTTLHIISWYDNTSGNKYNPDPRNPVGFGNRSVDEMSFSWINAYSLSQEEFKKEVAERAARQSTNNH
jgi:hypothetical protein